MPDDRVLTLASPDSGVGVHEPHIAIDPANPERIAAGAQYGIRSGHGGYGLRLWSTENGGTEWFDARVPRPLFDDGFMADPFLVFAEDGGLLYFGDCAPREVGEAVDRHHYDRFTVPDFWDIGTDEIEVMRRTAPEWRMGVSRTEDGGRTFTGTVLPDSADSDKPSVGVDRNPESPYYGAIHAGWAANFTNDLYVSTSTDHGRTFGKPTHIPCEALSHRFQLVVRPDGSIHVVWFTHYVPDGAATDAATAVYHAYSIDGARTFTKPGVIGRHAGPELTSIPTLGCDAKGRMLFVWGQADTIPDPAARPPQQSRRRLMGVRSDDGVSWTEPYELCPWVPVGTTAALPAIASDGGAWWIVCYLANEEKVDAVLLRSADGTTFELDRTLATRSVHLDRIRLWGTHAMVYCDDIGQIGDYIGIAATPSRVAAVFILPETDEPTSTATAYVATVKAA
jgi:hypothetical protein